MPRGINGGGVIICRPVFVTKLRVQTDGMAMQLCLPHLLSPRPPTLLLDPFVPYLAFILLSYIWYMRVRIDFKVRETFEKVLKLWI